MILLNYPPKVEGNKAIKSFFYAMDAISSSIEDLTALANLQFTNLKILQGHLIELQGLIYRENLAISAAKLKLSSRAWTKVGENCNALKKLDHHLELLIPLTDHHKLVHEQVIFTLLALQGVVEDLGEVISQVLEPNVVNGQIPVEILAKGVKLTLNRMSWRVSL
ncbi:hypothetical protein GYMLUDRAFT_248648 [Collybiopsis luxurians FD-317 M1]|uniref:Uncharacterized protein n=1 Tax=Collybiopsis luxurians FD-317 M1 TaxID=944289 RepID=A0A0D0CK32_9AGAR|nr:hypothetical protein GYMLUDRAFT_248648 [Collybiopsis luxurians FD-317 M1]